jgi:hypothetical protein
MIIEAGRLCKHKEGPDPSIEAGLRGGAGQPATIREASGGTRFRAKNTRGNYGISAKIAHFRKILLDFPVGMVHSNIYSIYRFVRR